MKNKTNESLTVKTRLMRKFKNYWPWFLLFGLILIYISYSIIFLDSNTYFNNTTLLLKIGLILNLLLFIRKCLQWYSSIMYVGNIDFVMEVDRPRVFYFSIFYISYLIIYVAFLAGTDFLIDPPKVMLSYILTSIVATAGAVAFTFLVLICSRWFG